QRKRIRQLPHFFLNPRHRRIIPLRQHRIDQLRHPIHLRHPEPARRQRRRAQPDAARHERRLRIARDRVLVDRDRRPIEQLPCVPGNTCLSTALAYSAVQRIIPPRGPRSVLCVVVVTICACGTGDGYTPPATSPAKCAMSTTNTAPTSSATARIAAKSTTRAY